MHQSSQTPISKQAEKPACYSWIHRQVGDENWLQSICRDCNSLNEVCFQSDTQHRRQGSHPVRTDSCQLEVGVSSDLTGHGFPEEVQEVTQGGGQSSKAGRHKYALSNDYLVTNTEIFQKFSQ